MAWTLSSSTFGAMARAPDDATTTAGDLDMPDLNEEAA